MAPEPKKQTLCPRCKKLGPQARLRSCDGCGRVHCPHMGKRTGNVDACGVCNLAASRAAKKAAAAKPGATP